MNFGEIVLESSKPLPDKRNIFPSTSPAFKYSLEADRRYIRIYSKYHQDPLLELVKNQENHFQFEFAAFSPDDTLIAFAQNHIVNEHIAGHVKLFNLEKRNELFIENRGVSSSLCYLNFSANGQFILAEDVEGKQHAWEIKTGSKISFHDLPDEFDLVDSILVRKKKRELAFA